MDRYGADGDGAPSLAGGDLGAPSRAGRASIGRGCIAGSEWWKGFRSMRAPLRLVPGQSSDAADWRAVPAGQPVTIAPPRVRRLRRPRPGPRLGERLVRAGALDPGDLVRALAIQAREEARLGEILIAHGMVSRQALLTALAEQWAAEVVDLDRNPPDTRLIDALGVSTCLADGLVPWRRAGRVTVVATARPERFAAHEANLVARLGPVAMAIAAEDEIARAVTRLRSVALARRAETRVPESESSRGLAPSPRRRRFAAAAFIGALAACLAAPVLAFLVLLAWASVTLAGIAGVKAIAVVRAVLKARSSAQAITEKPRRLHVFR